MIDPILAHLNHPADALGEPDDDEQWADVGGWEDH